jgi:hypothetical protein
MESEELFTPFLTDLTDSVPDVAPISNAPVMLLVPSPLVIVKPVPE